MVVKRLLFLLLIRSLCRDKQIREMDRWYNFLLLFSLFPNSYRDRRSIRPLFLVNKKLKEKNTDVGTYLYCLVKTAHLTFNELRSSFNILKSLSNVSSSSKNGWQEVSDNYNKSLHPLLPDFSVSFSEATMSWSISMFWWLMPRLRARALLALARIS